MAKVDIGIDEVGRGCLAGPLVVGAVSLAKPIAGLKDSKELTALQRQKLAKIIYETTKVASLGWVWPHEIDELGLTLATTTAMKRALKLIPTENAHIIIDGNFNYLAGRSNITTMIRADSSVPSVSAASIIAKVARDAYMHSIAQYFPKYDFASHVGYGTKKHLQAISLNGPCCLHRLSFAPLAKESLYSL